MINFNKVNFSERHSEEVIFLLTLSVYIYVFIFNVLSINYRKPGWLWTDFHYFHRYIHNDEFNSSFHMGIS